MYPTKQIAVAEMRVMLEQTKALWFQAISEARANPSKEQVLRAYAAQHTVMENANALAAKAIRTCGGQAMLKNLALERIYRDSRCGSLMLPWTAEICLDRLGRESLYEPGETGRVTASRAAEALCWQRVPETPLPFRRWFGDPSGELGRRRHPRTPNRVPSFREKRMIQTRPSQPIDRCSRR